MLSSMTLTCSYCIRIRINLNELLGLVVVIACVMVANHFERV